MGAGNTQAGSVIWLIILLFPSIVWAAQIGPAPVREVITTGDKMFNAGETSNPSFNVPNKNLGVYSLAITCDPLATITVDAGPLGKFTRPPGTCVDLTGKPITKIIIRFTRRDDKGDLKPIPVISVPNKVISDRAFKGALEVTFDKSP